jgi:hypothetical protein
VVEDGPSLTRQNGPTFNGSLAIVALTAHLKGENCECRLGRLVVGVVRCLPWPQRYPPRC